MLFAKYRETPEFRLVNFSMTLDGFKGIFWLEYIHRLWGRLIGVVFLVPFLWFWIRGRIPELARTVDRGEDVRPFVGVLASRIAAHIRFEENELFQAAQQVLDEPALTRLGDASRGFRSKRRDPAGCQLP